MSARRMFSNPLTSALLVAALLGSSAQADQIKWRSNLDSAKIEAGRSGKLILLHFYTSSCGPCKKLEREVFSQPQIGALVERDYVPVKINADVSPALAHAYQIQQVPSEVVLTQQGNVIQKLSCPMEPNAYGTQLANVAKHYNQRAANRNDPIQAPVQAAYAGLKIGRPENVVQTPAASPKKASTSVVNAVPSVTNNPYFTPTPPAQKQVAAVPAAQTQRYAPVTPTLPANAMPNSYRNHYAASAPTVSTPAPATPPVAKVTKQAVSTPTTATVAAAKSATPSARQPAQREVAIAAPASVKAWPPQLPAGTPPLAFDGHCPISLKQVKKWVRGNKAFGAIHRGRTYLFVGDAQRKQFLANPDAYSPVFSGYDPVKMLDKNEQVTGKREFGLEYRNAFYLFSSKETLERFSQQPDRYSAGVRQAMNRMDASAGGTVRR